MNPVGIDFGTTNSVVATFGDGKVSVLPIAEPPPKWAGLGFEQVFPSVLGVAGDRATVGWKAKQQDTGKLEAVKRLFASVDEVDIGGTTYSVELAAAALFAALRVGASSAGLSFNRAVVTIPANSRGLARFRTKLCAGLAGIEVSALINEPTAAAMAHSLTARNDQNILVFDWGGGTLDVTVLQTIDGVFIERASKGIQRSGGIDLDNLFAAEVSKRVPSNDEWSPSERALFRLEIERAKILLSSQPETSIALPRGGILDVTRAELERAVGGKVRETREPIDQCLNDLNMPPSGIDHLVLVGGSSIMPLAREFVAEVIGREPVAGVDPMTAVAQGAAVAAAILSDQLDSDFFVSTEHALGTIALNEYAVASFSVLIPRNHNLPAKAKGSYVPARQGQEEIMVRVIEGDPSKSLDHSDNVLLKEWVVPVDASRPQAEAGFDILYDYDVDGILHVTVTDQKTGQEMLRDDVSFGVSKDKAALVQTAKDLRELIRTGKMPQGAEGRAMSDGQNAAVDPVSRAVLERVRRKIVPFVDDAEAARLEAMCRDLEHADAAAAERCRLTLENECRQYAYLF